MFPPHVLYIGLQKTGSTFLRGYFHDHPQIDCTRNGKFFLDARADLATRSAAAVRADYAACFERDPARPCRIDMYEAIGMGYVLHGIDDWNADVFVRPGDRLDEGPVESAPAVVAARVAAALPDARILITVREQGAWIDSNYRHYFEQLPAAQNGLGDFLRTREGQLVLDVAMFDRLVDLYDDAFGRERVCVLPMERLDRDEAGALSALCAFLEVDFLPYRAESRSYNRGRPLSALRGAGAPAPWFTRWLAGKPAAGLDDEAQLALLRTVYAASNTRLATRLGVDLRALGYVC